MIWHTNEGRHNIGNILGILMPKSPNLKRPNTPKCNPIFLCLAQYCHLSRLSHHFPKLRFLTWYFVFQWGSLSSVQNSFKAFHIFWYCGIKGEGARLVKRRLHNNVLSSSNEWLLRAESVDSFISKSWDYLRKRHSETAEKNTTLAVLGQEKKLESAILKPFSRSHNALLCHFHCFDFSAQKRGYFLQLRSFLDSLFGCVNHHFEGASGLKKWLLSELWKIWISFFAVKCACKRLTFLTFHPSCGVLSSNFLRQSSVWIIFGVVVQSQGNLTCEKWRNWRTVNLQIEHRVSEQGIEIGDFERSCFSMGSGKFVSLFVDSSWRWAPTSAYLQFNIESSVQ